MTTKTFHDGETPAQGKQVFTACAFIYSDVAGVKKVLLPKRAAGKKFLPNVFELPGGRIEFGEDIRNGLIREVQEELGLNILLGNPFAAFTYNNEIKGSHSIEVVYFAVFSDPNQKIKINPEDHSEYGLFSEVEVSKNTDITEAEKLVISRGFALLKYDADTSVITGITSTASSEVYTGTIVEESLEDNRIINNFKITAVRISSDQAAENRWHLYKVQASPAQLKELSENIKPQKWYAHFWCGDEMLVVFKGKIFRQKTNDKESWNAAINYGLSLGIPKEQLDFLTE